MRAPTYRSLFAAALVLLAAASALAVTFYRRHQLASDEVRLRNEMNPFAISLNKTRDREFSFVVENYGFKYRGTTGNLIDDAVLVFGAWEKHVLFFLDDYTAATGTRAAAFVDVGANTGQYTLFMAGRVKRVHAVEPFPPVLRNLRANLALNEFRNVTVHEVGLGEKPGTIPFFEPADANHGGGSFRAEGHDGRGQTRSADLPVTTGDELLKDAAEPIGTVKIDIEGFEEPALKGLRRTLEAHRPLVVVEVSTPPAGTVASFDHLKGLFPENYEFLVLAEDQSQFLSGRYQVAEFAPRAEEFFRAGGQRNVVAVPAEYAARTPRRRP
jgi:FkbM family methyltransferase